MVKQNLVEFQGRVEFETELFKGSEFRFSLIQKKVQSDD